MNVTENYILQKMQAIASAMSGAPQAGSKDKAGENGNFQEMLGQVGKVGSGKLQSRRPADTTQPVKEKVEAAKAGEGPAETDEAEELKPEQLAANPNAVNILDLFRPDVVQPAEEPVIDVPVDAIAEEAVEAPDLSLDGQMPMMEPGVEANVDAEVPMERQPEGSFQSAVKEVPMERTEEMGDTAGAVEAAEAPEAAPGQAGNADKLREEAPEIEARAEADDEPAPEAAETQQPVFHEAQSTPVKVGEAYETVDTGKPDMEQKLADTIQAAAQAGAERVEIHLAPQNLGSLTIEMTKDASGALQVVLHTSNAKAAGVLNQHLDGLQLALRGYSREEVRIEVQRNEESQQQNFRQADPDGRGQQQRQQQERHEENHPGDAFLQKLRLGLFGVEEDDSRRKE